MRYGKYHLGVEYELTVSRLCTETPRAGDRVLEEGDKKLLALAHKLGSLFFLPCVR